MCDRFSNALQNIAGGSHVAYCTGPAQLAYLLSAFDVSGISPGDCLVYITASLRAVDLVKNLRVVCGQIGMTVGDEFLLPKPTLKETLVFHRNAGYAHPLHLLVLLGRAWQRANNAAVSEDFARCGVRIL